MINKNNIDSDFRFNTRLIHGGEAPDSVTGSIAPTLVRSKTFKQKVFREEAKYQYGRGNNPTREALEQKLVSLEGEGEATLFSSGNSAVTAILLTLSPGDHILFGKEVYGGTYRLLENVFKKFGINYDFIDFSNRKEVLSSVKQNTKYFFVETISNPSLHVTDLSLVSEISKKTRVPFIVDSTFLPPNAIRNFTYGAETIVYSLSKYFAGHNDVIGGAVITKNKKLHEQLRFLQRTVGAVLSPDETYRVLQGIKTLDIRWKKVSETALLVAKYLSKHPKVKRVIYPLLLGDKNYRIAKKQLFAGAGGIVSFELKAKSLIKVESFVKKVTKNNIIIYGESLASPQSLLAYPAWMSHKALSQEDRDLLGISDSFFRFSVGFEDALDIIGELGKGLSLM